MNKGVTLIEIVIVCVIIGILAALGIANYGGTKENLADKEAIANLKLIQASERAYMIDMSTYYPSAGSVANIASINSEFKLLLPAGSNRNWDYAVWSSGCSRATRSDGSRSWYLTIENAGEPLAGDGCP